MPLWNGRIYARNFKRESSLRGIEMTGFCQLVDFVAADYLRAHFQSPRISATFNCNPSGVTVAASHGASILSAIRDSTPRG